MGTAIIACQTLRDELTLAIKQTGVDFPVIYVEAGLHNTPELLHQKIQGEINRIDNVDTLLLVFGYCGNSMLGIKSDKATLVIPRVEDCIPLLFGSCDARKKFSKEMGTYFLTKGWLDYEKNLLWEYERCVERYGQTKALKIMKIMLNHYKRFMLIDTGAYSVKTVLPQIQQFAANLQMAQEIAPGSLRLLHKLLQGVWDADFLVLEQGNAVEMSDICIGDEQGVVTQSISLKLCK